MSTMIKSLWERFSQRERIVVFASAGLLLLLLLLLVFDVVGGVVFTLVFLAVLAGVVLLGYRVYKRDEVPLPRTSRAPGAPTAPLGRRALLWAGYSAFWMACFALFAYWSFPYHRVKDYLIQEVERPMGPGERRVESGVELSIDELSPSFVTGVHLEGILYRKLGDAPDEDPVEIAIDEASVRVSILSLLTGGLGLSYGLTVGDGTIEGEFEQSDTTQRIAAKLTDVDLLNLGFIRGLVGLPIAGELSGEIDVTVAEEAAETVGSIALTIEGLQIGDGEAKFPIGGMSDGLTIEQIDAGTLTISLEVEEGVAEVTDFASDGPDLELGASGNVRLAQPFERSRMDLLLRVNFTDAYKDKSQHTRNLFTALEMSPQVRPARTTDGALQYRVSGAFGGRVGTRPAGREPPPGD